MENEDSYFKCVPIIPRLGKKILLVLVSVNVLIIWLVCKRSDYFTVLNSNTVKVTTNFVNRPLYDVPLFHIPLLYTKDMAPYYVEVRSNMWCLKEGADLILSKQQNKCVCLTQWFGLDCGIPSCVWKSDFMHEGKNAEIKIMRREKPRRIILSIIFEDTFDLLDISIQNLFQIVDVFLIGEERNQNMSSVSKFKQGHLATFQNKIMPIQLNRNASYTNDNDRIISLLEELWTVGWNKLSDFRPDDIFVFSHVSSVISGDALLFLKLYDGFSEPFYFNLRPLIFTFSKGLKTTNDDLTLVPFEPLGCTLQFLSALCDYSVSKCLKRKCVKDKSRKALFEKQYWLIKEWGIGGTDFPSGWQCNLCCNSNCIRETTRKRTWLQAISNSLSVDHKVLNVSAIEKLIRMDKYSNRNISFNIVSKSDTYLSPKIVTDFEKYEYLLK